MKNLTVPLLIGSLLATDVSALTQEGVFKIDEVGHADISIKQTLNAQQWQQWMGVYGNSQSVMKRDLKSDFAAYHMDDFAMTRKDSDREFEVTFSAHGAATYHGNDRWEVDLEDGVRARKLSESQWLIQMNQSEGGELIEQDFTFELPPGVTSSEKAVSELGDDVIRYVLPTEPAVSGGMSLYGGGATAALGLALLGFGFTRKETKPVTVVAEPVREIAKEADVIDARAADAEAVEHKS